MRVFKEYLVLVTLLAAMLVFGSGCAGKRESTFDWKLSDARLADVNSALKVDMPSCTDLQGLKVYTSFSTGLKGYVFLEDETFFQYPRYNDQIIGYYIKKRDITYPGDVAAHLKVLVDKILVSQCQVSIVGHPDSAEIVIKGTIEKFHSQVIDRIYEDRWFHMKTASIVDIRSEVNQRTLDYEELLGLIIDVKSDQNSDLIGHTVNKQRVTDVKTYLNNEFLLSQYSIVYVDSLTHNLFKDEHSTTYKTSLKAYGNEDGRLLREFRDFHWQRSSEKDLAEFDDYRILYATSYGNLLYLVNDYVKNIIERIHDEVQ